MCGVAGIVNLNNGFVPNLENKLNVMNQLIVHRGPDGAGTWMAQEANVGFAHSRLSIIDLTDHGAQPMTAPNGSVLTFNGEIYNYLELQRELSSEWNFESSSDSETILAAYEKYGSDCTSHLRGMFAFAVWDERKKRLFAARDRFGIKPFYYAVVGDTLIFASEIKALLPLLPDIRTDAGAFSEYLTFQYTIGEHTLFEGVKQLMPGHQLVLENGQIKIERYWDVCYDIDYMHTAKYFDERLRELLDDSIDVHLRSDVPIGSYLSGGIDSSLIASLAIRHSPENNQAFHGKFTCFDGYDESHYAQMAADSCGQNLHQIDISAKDFCDHIEKVVYHLDVPTAGPGSFPQYMVSKLASEHVKVVLGGQGGDEIFGGYARYVVAYFEQAIKAAIDGTYKNGNFVVTPESIIPNLGVLREYKPLIKEFWREGLFEPLDARYFRLVDRSTDMKDEVDWHSLNREKVFEDFKAIFNNHRNVRKEAYFDSMTHFDFKCLLPALLQVEDRMSMAHGLESRVPFLDHRLIEFVATVPADIKFESGHMKHMIKQTYKDVLPSELVHRRDKMGFPVPLREWFAGELSDMVQDIFHGSKTKTRDFINYDAVLQNFDKVGRFSRKTWGLLSLELWHQQFHDKAAEYRAMLR
ncbi:asparagine synthase (glutamine-hydrolyzing) [Aestuariispira ectoiniformans]|uniref:asparagine synthase (glutamine-hydrolyzing) n=1 Tax=Aestuariispira ectoiniformans TaxID=2775080 RepID=UPI00223AC85C|nr:asparagine synthase (glutamine-hydrolyzing) [Aestuariispira ectoiniformans]